jgi:hypothetical protein
MSAHCSAGIAEELLSALQEEEAEEECFIWPLALEDRTDQTAMPAGASVQKRGAAPRSTSLTHAGRPAARKPENECFIWPLALEDRTDQTDTVPPDPFFKGLLQDIEQKLLRDACGRLRPKAGRCAAKHQPDTCRAARRAQAGERLRLRIGRIKQTPCRPIRFLKGSFRT